MCTQLGSACVSYAVDTWGGLGPSAQACLQQVLKRATAALDDQDRHQRKAEIPQNLSLAVMRAIGRQLGVANHVQQEEPDGT